MTTADVRGKLFLQLMTPGRTLLSVEVDSVMVPGSEGDFTVFPGHEPLIASLRPGSIEAHENGKMTERFFVGDGFVEITGHSVVILGTHAVQVSDLNRERLREELAALRERIAGTTAPDALARLHGEEARLTAALALV